MNEFFNNDIMQWIFAAIMGMLILGLFGWLKFKKDEKIVTEFLKKSGVETSHKFRTTHAISSVTNLSHERIKNICSKSSRIERDHIDKESWKISK